MIKNIFRLIRILNLSIVLFAQVIVRVFVVGPKEQWFNLICEPNFILLSLGTLLIAAAGYIINDYYDVKIDVINKPNKMVIERSISRRTALLLYNILNFTALLLGMLLSKNVFLFFAGTIFILWLYSNRLKRIALIGNITVAYLSASSILILGLYYQLNDIILFFSIFSFIMSLIREIIKDMEDMRGDAKHGCKTLPIVWGIKKIKIILYLLLALLFFSFGYYQHTHTYFHYSINLSLLIPSLYFGIKLYFADHKNQFDHLSSIAKIILIIGVVTLIFAAQQTN